jgi:hypothetical protein
MSWLACSTQGFIETRTDSEDKNPRRNDKDQSTVSEPVMIGGTFLACQPQDSRGLNDYQVRCRLQRDEQKVGDVSEYQANFQAVSTEDRYLLDYELYDPAADWHWLVYIPRDLSFDRVQLSLSGDSGQSADMGQKFEVSLSDETLTDDETIRQASVQTIDSLQSTETFVYQLASEPTLLSNGTVSTLDNADCDQNLLATLAESPDLAASRGFELTVAAEGTVMTLVLPKLCGVSESDNLGRNAVRVTFPDGSQEAFPIEPGATKAVIFEDRPVSAGSLQVEVISRPVVSIFDTDDFIFWGPEVVANGKIQLSTP